MFNLIDIRSPVCPVMTLERRLTFSTLAEKVKKAIRYNSCGAIKILDKEG